MQEPIYPRVMIIPFQMCGFSTNGKSGRRGTDEAFKLWGCLTRLRPPNRFSFRLFSTRFASDY